ncbi:uncharacterized protein APUU_51281A [Aspergillus puulaauensis]|uniref:Uncharacterized protein n=1 Tax=Aspergillus puulaauensis TaxID=1220207 RepID=A0A7R7XRV8_9EURO|nr:uncharacterized protein APUU_51281A [Aspergillus puulaauensis]BCS26570.1 hypothetical protein APUU_51281A [Aspergillus puulaauensis]
MTTFSVGIPRQKLNSAHSLQNRCTDRPVHWIKCGSYTSPLQRISSNEIAKVLEARTMLMPYETSETSHTYFCSEFFDTPIKGINHVDPPQPDRNRVVVSKETGRMGEVMTKVVSGPSGYLFSHLSRLFDRNKSTLTGFGPELVKRLREGRKSVEEAVWTIIPTAAAACATQAQGAQLLDLYLSGKYAAHWPAIRSLAQSKDPGSFEKLKKYALEGYVHPLTLM